MMCSTASLLLTITSLYLLCYHPSMGMAVPNDQAPPSLTDLDTQACPQLYRCSEGRFTEAMSSSNISELCSWRSVATECIEKEILKCRDEGRIAAAIEWMNMMEEDFGVSFCSNLNGETAPSSDACKSMKRYGQTTILKILEHSDPRDACMLQRLVNDRYLADLNYLCTGRKRAVQYYKLLKSQLEQLRMTCNHVHGSTPDFYNRACLDIPSCSRPAGAPERNETNEEICRAVECVKRHAKKCNNMNFARAVVQQAMVSETGKNCQAILRKAHLKKASKSITPCSRLLRCKRGAIGAAMFKKRKDIVCRLRPNAIQCFAKRSLKCHDEKILTKMQNWMTKLYKEYGEEPCKSQNKPVTDSEEACRPLAKCERNMLVKSLWQPSHRGFCSQSKLIKRCWTHLRGPCKNGVMLRRMRRWRKNRLQQIESMCRSKSHTTASIAPAKWNRHCLNLERNCLDAKAKSGLQTRTHPKACGIISKVKRCANSYIEYCNDVALSRNYTTNILSLWKSRNCEKWIKNQNEPTKRKKPENSQQRECKEKLQRCSTENFDKAVHQRNKTMICSEKSRFKECLRAANKGGCIALTERIKDLLLKFNNYAMERSMFECP